MSLFKTTRAELDEIQSLLAWLESKEAVVHIVNGLSTVDVYEQIDGVRVRRAEGVSGDLLFAIQDAKRIMGDQDVAPS